MSMTINADDAQCGLVWSVIVLNECGGVALPAPLRVAWGQL
jgi:hypothetical protein